MSWEKHRDACVAWLERDGHQESADLFRSKMNAERMFYVATGTLTRAGMYYQQGRWAEEKYRAFAVLASRLIVACHEASS